MEISVTVDAGTAGSTITNIASLTTSTPADANSANDSASASVVVQQPDLSILKTVDSIEVLPGSPVTFTITVTNVGGGNATSVTVNDLLPAGVDFDSSTASQGTYDSGSGDWSVGALAAGGGSATLEIVAVVSGLGETTNTATITASTPADASTGNNAASQAVAGVATATAVPSLSLLGLILLSVALAATAFRLLRH